MQADMSLQARDLGKVAVLMGGSSAEREVSMMSGTGVLAALKSKGVDAHAFDPAQRDLSELKREFFDRCFIALHGRHGEDGTVQGALELMGIPYTGSGVMASAIGMDKWRTKLVWLSSGLPTPRFAILDANTDWEAVVADLGLPIFVKPVHEGSSMGATKVTEAGQLKGAWELASRYDSMVLAEEFARAKAPLRADFFGDTLVGPTILQHGTEEQKKFLANLRAAGGFAGPPESVDPPSGFLQAQRDCGV